MQEKIEEMKKDIHTVLLHNCKYDFCEGVLIGFNEEGIARELYDEGYRKQTEGEWKYPPYAPFGGSYEMKRCSVCGYKPDFESDNPYTKFCPNCGAKMKVE